MRVSIGMGMALCFIGCGERAPEPRTHSAPAAIDPSRAKQLALGRYRQLFEDKYFVDQAGQQCRPMPAITADDINRVEDKGDAWLIAADPPAGMALEARVAKDGSWIEVVRVRWAVE